MPEAVSRDQLAEAGRDRLEDARFLQAQPNQSRPDGASYIAGYSIECWLKTAILKGMDENTSHNIDKKSQEYFYKHRYSILIDHFAAFLPDSVKSAMEALPAPVKNWDPQWRYHRRGKKREDAERFVAAADEFWKVVRGAT